MIHFAEFYSLTKIEKVENIKAIKKYANKNIKIFHENQINIDQISRKMQVNALNVWLKLIKNQ